MPERPIEVIRVSSGDHEAARTTQTAWRRNWHELGDFIVSFGWTANDEGSRIQTKVYYSQGDRQAHWDNVDLDALMDWISDRARAFVPPEQLSRLRQTAASTPVLKFEYLELTRAGEGLLHASGHICLQREAVSVEQIRTDLFLQNLETGVKHRVATDEGNIASDRLFECDFAAPVEAGRYQLVATAQLPASGGLGVEFAGRTLRVEA